MEPPYAERHVRWCERTHEEIILMLLLDFIGEQKKRLGISLFDGIRKVCLSAISVRPDIQMLFPRNLLPLFLYLPV